MRRAVPLLLVVFLVVAVTASAAPPKKTTVVEGENDSSVDRQAIQDAIDDAGKNDTVELFGTFKLDGTAIFVTRGDITIAGRRIDNDHDGTINEDWADGIDNDGDGDVDEDGWDAVLQGILTVDGRPDEMPLTLYNRGLIWRGFSGTGRNITVRDIEFSGLVRGVTFEPSFVLPAGFLCDDLVVTEAAIHNSTVERNHFTNSVRGFQIFGGSDHVKVQNNLATNIRASSATPSQSAFPILLVGESLFCIAPDGSDSSVPFGSPQRTHITGNSVSSESTGIGGFSAPETNVSDNEAFGGSLSGIVFGAGSDKAHIQNNTVDGFRDAIQVGANDSHVQNNILLNSSRDSIILFGDATGNKVINNLIDGFGFVGIFLGGNTFENTIRLNGKLDIFDVLDLGTDNSVKQ